MKKQDDLSVGGALFLSVIFAIMAILSYNSDESGNPIAIIPAIGVIVGLVMALNAKSKASDRKARKEQQDIFAQTLDYDDCFGNGDLKLYFNSQKQDVTVCATTNEGRNTQVVRDFSVTETVKTDSYIVSYDATHNKILRIKNNNGNIMLKEFNLNYTLKKWNVILKKSTPAVKAYNDYAFITDDVNEFVAIVTPTSMHLHRYSDIVSITYEENGNDMYNKSLGGAVVGGLLFGGVGAIVGSNTAKAVKNKKIEMMSIKILLKSTSEPTILLEIYNSRNDGAILETKKDADKIFYEGLMKEVTGIKDIFSIIIDIVDKSSASQKQQISVSASNSIADELAKLVQLKDAGVLTEEEFQAQKAKLLQ